MSQVRRHDHDNNSDHQLSPTTTTTPTSPPLSSRLPFPPPAGAGQSSGPSDLNNNLIPRNYLGRSDAVTPRPNVTVDTSAAHRRHNNIPSPRHPPPSGSRSAPIDSYDTYNNNPHHHHYNHNNYSNYNNRDSPASHNQSPILGRNPFASERGSPITPVSSSGFPVPPTRLRQSSSAASMATPPTERVEAATGSENNENGKTTAAVPSRDPTEKPSGATTSAQSSNSTPSPPPPRQVVQTVAGRQVPRGIPRTSSIDSAISSISTTSHSHKSSIESNISPADISSLVTAAGSPEAVIAHLLKEKSQAASQNAKLWGLVEKQRAMVIGLNKDLERAMKDKEKYRKKVKDLQNIPPPLPPGKSMTADGQIQGAQEESNLNNAPVTASTKSVPTDLDDAPTQNPMEASGMTPSPLHIQHKQVESSSSSPQDPTSEPSSPETSPTKTDPDGKSPSSPVADSRQPPSLAVVESSPTMAKSETMSPMARKAPPAPLNLGRASAHLHQAEAEDESDSDYDDILEVDEIPAVTERGRRKTREQDDREREEAALREQEARSISKKSQLKASKSPEKDKENDKQAPASGQRQMVPQSPPAAAAGFSHLYPPESQSLASVLSPPTSETSSARERNFGTPIMSPGLPTSPRPSDRPPGSPLPRMPRESGATSPPVSPRSGLPLSPRAPKQPIPLPPNTPLSLASPTAAKGNKSPTSPTIPDNSEMTIPTINATVDPDSPSSPRNIQRGISRRLVSEGYPDLLLPPNALPSIEIKVSSSRLRPSRNSYMAPKPSEEEPVFTLSVFSRSDGSELWRVEKVILALPQLDQQVKQVSNFAVKLPDRTIFSGHSPAKVDARRVALNQYFGTMLDTPMDETAALVVCRFLTSDAIEPRDDETNLLYGPGKARPTILLGPDGRPRKEGYLTKKGKNFGGWKARYFVLHSPEFKYYESPGGAHLGTIKIRHAQIGRQSQSGHSHSPSENDAEDQYRHAFLILEPKRKDSSALVRHVLCAESDEERDAWVEALLQYVESQYSDEESSQAAGPKTQARPQTNSTTKPGYVPSSTKKSVREADSPDPEKETLRAFSYDDVVAANAPIRGPSYDKGNGVPPSPARTGSVAEFHHPTLEQAASHKAISGPTNGTVIQDAGMWGNKSVTSGKEKKRSIWGFRARNSAELATPSQGSESTTTLVNNTSAERREPIMPVFGMPLVDAVEYCPPHGVDANLPAVAYRCIEYLSAKGAASEEGIFRLSGSNVVVKALKERFNTEGDVDILSGDHYYDVHAVASLFKQYLRELPTTVLTRELHLDFLRVLELESREKKIAAFSSLVHRLPKPNLSLLKALSQFLIVIINNSDVNKMTVRNVGIVFAPTLNIPAPVFSMFLTDFDEIFGEEPSDVGTKTVEITVDKPLTQDDIRSPRHQMFSDIPTPAYNQTSFQGMDNPAQGSHQDIRSAYDTGFIPMQPSYQQQPIGSDPNQRLGDPSQMRGLAPMNSNQQSRTKRRESSMLFMGMGNRKSSIQKSRDDQSLVAEDSAFE